VDQRERAVRHLCAVELPQALRHRVLVALRRTPRIERESFFHLCGYTFRGDAAASVEDFADSEDDANGHQQQQQQSRHSNQQESVEDMLKVELLLL